MAMQSESGFSGRSRTAVVIASGIAILAAFSFVIQGRLGSASRSESFRQSDMIPAMPANDEAGDESIADASNERSSEIVNQDELSSLENKLYELFAAHVNGITSIENVTCTVKYCESTYTATPQGHRDVGDLIPLFVTEMGAPSSSIRRVEISPGAYKYVVRVSFP